MIYSIAVQSLGVGHFSLLELLLLSSFINFNKASKKVPPANSTISVSFIGITPLLEAQP